MSQNNDKTVYKFPVIVPYEIEGEDELRIIRENILRGIEAIGRLGELLPYLQIINKNNLIISDSLTNATLIAHSTSSIVDEIEGTIRLIRDRFSKLLIAKKTLVKYEILEEFPEKTVRIRGPLIEGPLLIIYSLHEGPHPKRRTKA